MDGKRTLNASTVNEFRAPKIADSDRMISTAHDGGAGRGFRRRKVSTNFREMRESVDHGKQQQPGQRNDNPMLTSLESAAMISAQGPRKSLASHLVENKDRLLQLRDERDRTIEHEEGFKEKEKLERTATIASASESIKSQFQGLPGANQTFNRNKTINKTQEL